MIYVLGNWRYGLKRGMSGTDVGALQINLQHGIPGLNVDGDFGKQTETAVQLWQEAHVLTADGVVGPKTWQSLVVELSTPAARANRLPTGMAKSISFAESGFVIGASGPHLSDIGWDVGPYMISSQTAAPSQDFIRDAFDVIKASEKACQWLREAHERVPEPVPSQYLRDLAKDDEALFAWQLAVLSHNWPYAAQNIPRIGRIFNEVGRDDRPAEWIEQASSGNLHTPREWAVNYVRKSTLFVNL